MADDEYDNENIIITITTTTTTKMKRLGHYAGGTSEMYTKL
jgi:hypothetical protein